MREIIFKRVIFLQRSYKKKIKKSSNKKNNKIMNGDLIFLLSFALLLHVCQYAQNRNKNKELNK